jgi:hypothetical protein
VVHSFSKQLDETEEQNYGGRKHETGGEHVDVNVGCLESHAASARQTEAPTDASVGLVTLGGNDSGSADSLDSPSFSQERYGAAFVRMRVVLKP